MYDETKANEGDKSESNKFRDGSLMVAGARVIPTDVGSSRLVILIRLQIYRTFRTYLILF